MASYRVRAGDRWLSVCFVGPYWSYFEGHAVEFKSKSGAQIGIDAIGLFKAPGTPEIITEDDMNASDLTRVQNELLALKKAEALIELISNREHVSWKLTVANQAPNYAGEMEFSGIVSHSDATDEFRRVVQSGMLTAAIAMRMKARADLQRLGVTLSDG